MDTNTYYIDNGISLENRIIDLTGDIDEDLIAKVRRAIHIMSYTNMETITIIVNSYGGNIYEGLALIDAINAAKLRGIKFQTIATGKVMSMGLSIFIHGDIRIAHDNVSFMAHSASSGSHGKLFEQEINISETKALNELLMAMLSEKSKRKLSFWQNKLKYEDYYFNSTEAYQMGIANTKAK